MRLEDFGIILLMLAACAAALFGGMALVSLWPQIRQFVRALWRRYVTFSWDDLLWRVADGSVNDFEEPAPPPFANRPVMSRSERADGQTDQTDGADRRQSAPILPKTRTALDRTRRAVIEQLLTDGWTLTDLRREGILRGDNKIVGDEVAAARVALGLDTPSGAAPVAAPDEILTPIAGRRTRASYYPDEQDLEFSPLR